MIVSSSAIESNPGSVCALLGEGEERLKYLKIDKLHYLRYSGCIKTMGVLLMEWQEEVNGKIKDKMLLSSGKLNLLIFL